MKDETDDEDQDNQLLMCVFSPRSIPLAIYLAKKNIRKQGELMEYEKVRSTCVSMTCRSRECVYDE